jgi:hypothetical protein
MGFMVPVLAVGEKICLADALLSILSVEQRFSDGRPLLPEAASPLDGSSI